MAHLQSCRFKTPNRGTLPIWSLKGLCVTVTKMRLASLLVSDKFSTIKRSWVTEERCTAILFGTTMVLSVLAPDSKKSVEMYEEGSAVKVPREGRKVGAMNFYIAGDINVELGLMCTNENEEDELTKLYGPLCWQGYDKGTGGFKKIMWCGIMKESDCKVSSSWSVCGKVRAEALTHRHLGKDRKEELSQLDQNCRISSKTCDN